MRRLCRRRRCASCASCAGYDGEDAVQAKTLCHNVQIAYVCVHTAELLTSRCLTSYQKASQRKAQLRSEIQCAELHLCVCVCVPV
jgi:hypothetical protein